MDQWTFVFTVQCFTREFSFAFVSFTQNWNDDVTTRRFQTQSVSYTWSVNYKQTKARPTRFVLLPDKQLSNINYIYLQRKPSYHMSKRKEDDEWNEVISNIKYIMLQGSSKLYAAWNSSIIFSLFHIQLLSISKN